MSNGRHRTDREMRAAERAHDRTKDYEFMLLEAATRDAQEAMKVALAINGGAGVAVLGFASAIAYKGGIALGDLIYMMISLGLFALGVTFAAITAACAYFSNSLSAASNREMHDDWDHPYSHPTDNSKRLWRWGRRLNWIAVDCALLALGLFVGGLIVAGIGIWNLGLVKVPDFSI